MRVAYLAAGAGGMYCGSCLRDNLLAATLIAAGRDIVLVPLYTPLRTDTPSVASDHVYYGGINVYLQQHSWLFRHTPRALDNLFDSPGLLRRAMKLAGSTSGDALGALTLSVLRGEHGHQAKELDKLIDGLREMSPRLVNLPNLMFVGAARRMKEVLRVPILCTLGGEDLFLDKLPDADRDAAERIIRERTADVDGFIAVSRYYAEQMIARFGLEPTRVHVVPLGVGADVAGETGDRPAEPFRVGYLARICHDKGLHILAAAFRHLHQNGRPIRLTVAGYLPPEEQRYLDGIRRDIDRAGLSAHFEHVGEVDLEGKRRFLSSLHVLSVPTVYRESKGLPVLEAMANGVPVVQPAHGAFPELIEATGGGLLFEPNDHVGLAERISLLMDDSAMRERLGAQGRASVREAFSDHRMADATWDIYGSYVSRGI